MDKTEKKLSIEIERPKKSNETMESFTINKIISEAKLEQHQETKTNICNEIEATLRTHPHKGLEWGRGYLYSLNELLNKIKGGQI